MGGDRCRAEPGGDRARRHEARLKRQRAQQQIAAHHHLGAQHRRLHAQRHPLDEQARREQQRRHPLPHQVGHGRAGQFEPRHAQPAVHQQRAQHRRHREAGDDVAQWPRGVLHAAHPAVARRRHQDRGHADDRDPHPRQRLVGDVPPTPRPVPTPAAPPRPAPRRRSARRGPAPARWPAPLPRPPPRGRPRRRTAPNGRWCRRTGTSSAS